MPCPTAPEIEAARRWLADRDPILKQAHDCVAPFDWRERPGGFAGLVQLITEQQVSTASAAAIWARVVAGLGEVTAERVLSHDEAGLKAYGLSTPKARYTLGIAAAHAGRTVDLEALAALDDEAAIAALVSLKGVGRWTAEVYLLFCEGRLDAFPAGDLALQEAVRWLEGAEVRPNEKALYARAEVWRPYRGVATHLLWDYYLGRRAGTIAEET
jgi:DNA-3-methyladenine glycosylase II